MLSIVNITTDEEEEEQERIYHLGNGGMQGSKCISSKIKQGKSNTKASMEQKNKIKYGKSFLKIRIVFAIVSRRPEI
jgi:hypothetical protein